MFVETLGHALLDPLLAVSPRNLENNELMGSIPTEIGLAMINFVYVLAACGVLA